jgi:agmatine deiminase
MPAEWAPHDATWVAWPSHVDLWQDALGPVRRAFARLVAAVAQGETAEVLVPDDEQEAYARAMLPVDGVRYHRIAFGDIWLRDTAPLFLRGGPGQAATVRFAFNGWGGKYLLEDDDRVSERIAGEVDGGAERAFVMPFVLEGGAVDVDGQGTVLTTRQCLLNPNRNGVIDQKTAEGWLCDALGAERVLWLGDGLLNDHTDGHVDTVVRFVRPGTVVAMEARGNDDPNRAVLGSLLREAEGYGLDVVRIPSPGRVLDAQGRVMPASYVNFYVANTTVVVPTYGSPWDDEAVERVGALFPGRRAVGIEARGLLTGGGAFHCITQQQPAARG